MVDARGGDKIVVYSGVSCVIIGVWIYRCETEARIKSQSTRADNVV